MPAGSVLRRGLALAPRQPEQLDAAIGKVRDDLVGPIGRRIRDNEDLPPVCRIIDGENPFERGRNDPGLVVDGQHDADPGDGRAWRRLTAPAPQAAHQHQDRGIAEKGVDAKADGQRDYDAGQEHHAEAGATTP